ncbi:hypothetical protein [Streptomyces sp. 142MFCol3.1]|uniref:hypothetical protein n=1 Tax=Streptomyces sp. 142MFCol3.1 TaxID=1172179 RepID=UPI00042A6F50|nr:hypothetical protein [Streptomyces sp. 142MFCol3.1]
MGSRAAILALAAITTATLVLTGCSSDSKPDVAACKTALAKQLDIAVKAGDNVEEPSRPDECEGVNTATLARLIGEVNEEHGN